MMLLCKNETKNRIVIKSFSFIFVVPLHLRFAQSLHISKIIMEDNTEEETLQVEQKVEQEIEEVEKTKPA